MGYRWIGKLIQGVEVWQEVGSLLTFNSNKKVFVTIIP
jgi:hypothetical protein